MSTRRVLVLVVAVGAGCDFRSASDEAALYCSSDDDCLDGRVCDSAAHLCLPAGVETPITLRQASFTPTVARSGTVVLAIEADRALDTSAPVTVSLVGDGLVLVPQRVDGARVSLVGVADGLADGRYAVTAIALRGADGSEGSAVTDGLSFVVDAAPPQLFNVSYTDAPADLVFADVADRDTVAVTAIANEPLTSATLVVGPNVAPCTVDDLRRITCTRAVADLGDVGDATFEDVEVSVADLAGNGEVALLPGFAVDTAPPAIGPGGLAVVITRDGVAESVATARSVVEFFVDVNEPVDVATCRWSLVDRVAPCRVDGPRLSGRFVGAGLALGRHGV